MKTSKKERKKQSGDYYRHCQTSLSVFRDCQMILASSYVDGIHINLVPISEPTFLNTSEIRYYTVTFQMKPTALILHYLSNNFLVWTTDAQWNVITLILRGSNLSFFGALYCSLPCLPSWQRREAIRACLQCRPCV